jgi:hypothetical protein
MKIFISQPMTGLSNEEILKVRNEAIERIRSEVPDAEFIDSFKPEIVSDNYLWLLGRDIQLLGEADCIYMCENWRESKGCKIEHYIALSCGIEVILPDQVSRLAELKKEEQ